MCQSHNLEKDSYSDPGANNIPGSRIRICITVWNQLPVPFYINCTVSKINYSLDGLEPAVSR
jgi:hypothetical protein